MISKTCIELRTDKFPILYMKNEYSLQEEIKAAEAVRQQMFPDAGALFLAGSLVRGEGNEHSDLDIVVVYEHLSAAYRNSFTFARWPVEVFVHDPATLAYFFVEFDKKRGVPSLATMISEGVELPGPTKLSTSCKKMANTLLAQGPEAWDQTDTDASRYAITNLVDDIRRPRSYIELIAIGTELHRALATHVFRTRGMWSASGKMIPRQLESAVPEIAKIWQDCFTTLYKAGDSDNLVSMVEKLLEPDGGFLFEGYSQVVPASWRSNGDT